MLAACVGVVVLMLGMSYAAVPLYSLFCQVTGFGGTPQISTAESSEVLDRTIKVRFDSNVSPGLDWAFTPVQREITLRIGETGLAMYRASNRGTRPVTGVATFNVTPDQAGAYFDKVQCFCFNEQTLKPGETIDMPVVFYVDPELARDRNARAIQEITLSYTFFPAVSAQAAPASDR